MNKGQFLSRLYNDIGDRLPNQDIEFILDIISKTIEDGLVEDGTVKTPFGIFKVRERKSRRYRDISSGEIKILPARNVILYKPTKSIDGAINGEKDKA